jgi:hypothetical protein
MALMPSEGDLHNPKAQKDGQADLDAKRQVEFPEDERCEQRQKQINRRVETCIDVNKWLSRGIVR